MLKAMYVILSANTPYRARCHLNVAHAHPEIEHLLQMPSQRVEVFLSFSHFLCFQSMTPKLSCDAVPSPQWCHLRPCLNIMALNIFNKRFGQY